MLSECDSERQVVGLTGRRAHGKLSEVQLDQIKRIGPCRIREARETVEGIRTEYSVPYPTSPQYLVQERIADLRADQPKHAF